MTTVPVMADIKKLSFAKVAASSTRETLSARVAIPVATPSNSAHKSATPSVPAPVVPSIVAIPHTSPAQACQTPKITKRPTPAITELQDAADAMNDLSLEQRTPNLVVNGTSPNAPTRTGRGTIPKESSPEEKADSNSELGTKPPSLDGKSTASGTTFALDEKESLRPDDSASMKAAAEDDDAFSTRGSILAGSRMGSEQRGVKMIQFGDVPTARIIQTVPESQNLESPTPNSGESSQLPQAETKMPLGNAVGGSDAFNNAVYGQGPDEKLLEAMNSQKDRLFLLRLEKQVMEFVQDSKEPFMDLPPSNSFCRMLTHKLADYYRMTHSFEQTTASVRIFRTPFCRVPPSLASIVQASGVSENSTPPPVVLPKKIMRRGEDGSTAPPSANPSKPASEVGSDSKDKPLTKEKMTREEREEAYNKARQRIFGNSENTGESTPENEDSKGLSRASSISGKDKSNTAKRGKVNKRRDDNDNFETRSQYAALYGHPHQPWQAQYVPMNGQQYNTQMQQPPANAMYSQMPSQPVYMGGNQSQLQNMVPNNGFQYPNMPAYPQGGQPQYQQMNRPNAMQPGFPGAPPMAAGPQQNWQQGYNPGSAPYQSRPAPSPGNGIPYAYGQLPANANPNDPKSQHPIPGSYNRHAFNPKTHPFVPAVNGMAPMQPQPFNAPGPLHGSPQMAPAAMYPNYPPSYGNTGSFNMARQGSNNGLPPFHPQPPQPPHMAPTHSGAPHIPNKPAIPQGPSNHTGGANHNANFPHLPNYGNPATLPQKPPNPTSGV